MAFAIVPHTGMPVEGEKVAWIHLRRSDVRHHNMIADCGFRATFGYQSGVVESFPLYLASSKNADVRFIMGPGREWRPQLDDKSLPKALLGEDSHPVTVVLNFGCGTRNFIFAGYEGLGPRLLSMAKCGSINFPDGRLKADPRDVKDAQLWQGDDDSYWVISAESQWHATTISDVTTRRGILVVYEVRGSRSDPRIERKYSASVRGLPYAMAGCGSETADFGAESRPILKGAAVRVVLSTLSDKFQLMLLELTRSRECTLIRSIEVPSAVTSLSGSPDGRSFASTADDGRLSVWPSGLTSVPIDSPVASAARQGELEASAWVDDDHIVVGGMGDALGLYNFDQLDSLELIATLRQTGASATTYATAYCHSQAAADGRKGLRLLLSGGVDTYVMLSLCVSEERPRIPFPPEGAFFESEEVLNEPKRWKEWKSDRRVVRMVDSAEGVAAGEQCKREDGSIVSGRGSGDLARWRELESEAAPSASRFQGRVAAAKKRRTMNATGVDAEVVDSMPPRPLTASSKSHDDLNIQRRCTEVISAMISLVKKALSARGPIWLLDALRPIGFGRDTRDYNDAAVFNCELMRRELLMDNLRSLSAEDLLQYLDLTRRFLEAANERASSPDTPRDQRERVERTLAEIKEVLSAMMDEKGIMWLTNFPPNRYP
ncbi:hypothetical protein FOZ61_001017 [Perkinsus olseni]|uniref:Uncharacterized protein n=1 Tax=Perkinsus olseni TaxID=32597 RepID=A0A7J6LZ36_PEROL|nr:hypothetical protein FOZ61_001017 [Perkinsus olseni]